MLSHLHIQNFKCFRDLRIEPLGRVNLITGKNNTGKTSLLEGVALYAYPEAWHLFELRGEGEGTNFHAHRLDRFLALFYKYDPNAPIQINDRIYHAAGIAEEALSRYHEGMYDRLGGAEPVFQFKEENTHRRYNDLPMEFIKPKMASVDKLKDKWNRLQLTPKEQEVYAFLRIIDKRTKQLALVSHLGPEQFRVLMEEEEKAFPLNRLGDGMNKLLEIVLNLVNTPSGFLLIDEIETGLHYSILPKVWEYLFRLAKKYNVQIFATTHSADCVEAFAQVGSQKAYQHEARLIRLYRKDDEIGEVSFDIETVRAAVEGNIEMRG